MSDEGPAQQPQIATLSADLPTIIAGSNPAGGLALVSLSATNTSGRPIDQGEIGLWITAHSTMAESAADQIQPWWGVQPDEQAFIGGQLQLDPGEWQVHVQVIDMATSMPILDFPVQIVHIEGTVSQQTAYDESQPYLISVFIESAELFGIECRLHYELTNASPQPIPAGLRVTGTITGELGGYSAEVYHYTEALPPYSPQKRYLTLELVDLAAGGGGNATARILIDPNGPSEISDTVTLTFNGTGPVTVSP
jgi:hypothetical protein